MNIHKIIARVRRLRADEMGYRLKEGLHSLHDYSLGFKGSFPESLLSKPLPEWPIRVDIVDHKNDLFDLASDILLGKHALLGQPWDIHKSWGWDPVHQWAWPLSGSPIGLIGRGPKGVDPKFAWEPLRLVGLNLMALSGALGNEESKEVSLLLLRRLMDGHHPFEGFLYSSGIECAVRIISICLLNSLIGEDYTEKDKEQVWTLLWAHHQWLRRYPSRFSSGNNHRISELVGLLVVESAVPELQGSDPQGVAYELLQHIKELTHPDGVYVEQSLHYQATVMEWLLIAQLFTDKAKIYFPVTEVLRSMSKYLASMLGPEGVAPVIGDVDDSFILPMLPSDAYLLSVTQAVASHTKLTVPFKPIPDIRLALLGLSLPKHDPIMELRQFDHGGISILSQGDIRLYLDHGELGYDRLAAHGHADSLSVWLIKGKQRIWADFGSYCYSADPQWREWSRSTEAHNTVTIGHKSSSTPLGAFGWRKRAQSFLLSRDESHIKAAHDGYDGNRHTRRVEINKGGLEVQDEIAGSGTNHIAISYLLGPGLRATIEGKSVCIWGCDNRHLATCTWSGAPLSLKHYYGGEPCYGWRSTGYMEKEKATRLIWEGPVALPLIFKLKWRWE